jgi:hypothetical protein
MRISITVELRRPARRYVALLLGVLVLGIPAVALASDRFIDVPDGHPFHEDIDWLADYGITTGFSDGTYRPNDPVTRQAVAAFLHRFSNEFEWVDTAVDPDASAGFSADAYCPDDKRAIAGGGRTDITDLYITDSYPIGRLWRVSWESDNNVVRDPSNLTVFAFCAPRL